MPRLEFAIIAALMLTLAAGCGQNTTGNDTPPAKKGAVFVDVSEHPDTGLPGFEVTTEPPTISTVTDSLGKALLENIDPGTYTLMVRKENYPATFSRNVVVAADLKKTVAVTFFPKVTVNVVDETLRPWAGATIALDSPPREAVTGADGIAEFEYLVNTDYQFTVRRDRYPDASFTIAAAPELQLTVPTGSPAVAILSPENGGNIYSVSNVTLRGEATDIEDGALDGNSLEWWSNRNGVLGHGAEILAEALETGRHTITLTATDSDGKKGTASAQVTVYNYNLDSYFPIPENQTWEYQYLVPGFFVTAEDGSEEYWEMKSISVIVAEGPRRRVEMNFDIARGSEVAHCRYTLTDFLETQSGNLYITRTEEKFEEWTVALPYLTMDMISTYSPRYLLLKNIEDPARERSWTTLTDVNTNWSYIYKGKSSYLNQEWKPISTTAETGDIEHVTTPKGTFTALPVTMREASGVERTWYLAKRVGPVKFTDNTFAPRSTAVLKNASLVNFSNKGGVSGTPRPATSGRAVRLDFRVNRKTGDNLRDLTEFLARIAPR